MVADYDISLVPGTAKPVGAVATVLRPDGKPLVGASCSRFNTAAVSASRMGSLTWPRGG